MNLIEFNAPKEYLEANKELYPVPIKTNIPDWFKKLKHSSEAMTIKGCMPFLETLTHGYLLKTPQSLYIRHNFLNSQGQKDSEHKFALDGQESQYLQSRFMNLNTTGGHNLHNKIQLAGSPLLEKNKDLPVYKFSNPWQIKTPKGYSCLLLPPLNNSDDRFSIIPGIVETDLFTNRINFPFIINGDKYPTLETTIEAGTPYVQIIPFKRDDWKMKIGKIDSESIAKENFYYKIFAFQYKKWFHRKRKWI